MAKKIKAYQFAYTVLVDGEPAGLCLTNGMQDFSASGRKSFKGTRLCFDTNVAVFKSRKQARRAIKRTVRAVAELDQNAWSEVTYEITPLVTYR